MNRFNISFETSTLGVNDFNTDQDLAIYPNPSQGAFTLSSKKLNGQRADIYIYDTLGKIVFQSTDVFSSNEVNINQSQLATGIYYLKVNSDGQEFSQKLIIK